MFYIRTIKFIIFTAFLFSLAYINKERIPRPEELKTFDFITTSGIDIDLNGGGENFSISYISRSDNGGVGEGGGGNDKSGQNSGKNIFNVKSNTLSGAFDKLHNLTNKSVNDSHLEYILIGEETAKENLDYFTDYYSKRRSIRLSVKTFITKGMTSEDFIRKASTSEIDADAKLHGLVNDGSRISSLTKKNLKNLMQIFYSKDRTGLIPALAIKESPVETSKTDDNGDEKSYTFDFYGLGIIKDGKLKDYLPASLVRSYLILTGKLNATDIEVNGENGDLFVFAVKNSITKTSFEFDAQNKPEKVIFDVSIETEFDETASNSKEAFNLNKLNALQSGKIKSEIERLIETSRETDADFLGIGESLSIRHPYKWHNIKDEWHNLFKNIDYEIKISVKTTRYYNLNIKNRGYINHD
ncbi:MAG: Ger(x)C family spore germination protein [Oscillospiraceae bacterium]|nr:Ger(x)C family spore germination protein [Oscillospiraceae bacterium]